MIEGNIYCPSEHSEIYIFGLLAVFLTPNVTTCEHSRDDQMTIT